jgi:hypothetical protein
MTMHEPRPGIIRNERDNQPAIRGQHGDIPPRRIPKVKIIHIIIAEDLHCGGGGGGVIVGGAKAI